MQTMAEKLTKKDVHRTYVETANLFAECPFRIEKVDSENGVDHRAVFADGSTIDEFALSWWYHRKHFEWFAANDPIRKLVPIEAAYEAFHALTLDRDGVEVIEINIPPRHRHAAAIVYRSTSVDGEALLDIVARKVDIMILHKERYVAPTQFAGGTIAAKVAHTLGSHFCGDAAFDAALAEYPYTVDQQTLGDPDYHTSIVWRAIFEDGSSITDVPNHHRWYLDHDEALAEIAEDIEIAKHEHQTQVLDGEASHVI